MVNRKQYKLAWHVVREITREIRRTSPSSYTINMVDIIWRSSGVTVEAYELALQHYFDRENS